MRSYILYKVEEEGIFYLVFYFKMKVHSSFLICKFSFNLRV